MQNVMNKNRKSILEQNFPKFSILLEPSLAPKELFSPHFCCLYHWRFHCFLVLMAPSKPEKMMTSYNSVSNIYRKCNYN